MGLFYLLPYSRTPSARYKWYVPRKALSRRMFIVIWLWIKAIKINGTSKRYEITGKN